MIPRQIFILSKFDVVDIVDVVVVVFVVVVVVVGGGGSSVTLLKLV